MRLFNNSPEIHGERDVVLCTLNAWWFDPPRADPRFHALLRRMNFPETANG